MATVIHSASTHNGGRSVNQDQYLVLPNFGGRANCWLFAVLDGHGDLGLEAAKFAKEGLAKAILDQDGGLDALWKDPTAIIKQAFNQLDTDLLDEDSSRIDSFISGTTATVAVLDLPESDPTKGTLIVGHLGDSRVVVGTQKVTSGELLVEQLTTDHNCLVEEEKVRLEASGAHLSQLFVDNQHVGPVRVFKGSLPYPGIAVTRTLGDKVAKRLGVVSDPQVIIQSLDLKQDHRYVIIIACDGVWDGQISAKEAIETAIEVSPEASSQRLTDKSLKALQVQQLNDNVTNICIFVSQKPQ